MAKIVGLITHEERDMITAAGYPVHTSNSPEEEASGKMFWATVWVDCNVTDLLVMDGGVEMIAITFEEVRSAMTKRGYYVDKDSICIKNRKRMVTCVFVYKVPDPVKLTESVNFFVRTRGAWYESREEAVMSGVDNFMHALYLCAE